MSSETPALRLRPRETRGDRTRARLVDAGLAEFREHGFENASIARIAQAAGVSRPTFYFHFPKKEDLLRELLSGLEHDVADQVSRARSLPEALDALVARVLGVQAQLGAPVLAEMLRAQTRVLADEDYARPTLDALVPLFRQGAADGLLRRGLDPERAAAIYLSAAFGCLLDAEHAGQPEDLRALTSLFLREGPGE